MIERSFHLFNSVQKRGEYFRIRMNLYRPVRAIRRGNQTQSSSLRSIIEISFFIARLVPFTFGINQICRK